jgi:hypothetical protein
MLSRVQSLRSLTAKISLRVDLSLFDLGLSELSWLQWKSWTKTVMKETGDMSHSGSLKH